VQHFLNRGAILLELRCNARFAERRFGGERGGPYSRGTAAGAWPVATDRPGLMFITAAPDSTTLGGSPPSVRTAMPASIKLAALGCCWLPPALVELWAEQHPCAPSTAAICVGDCECGLGVLTFKS
jgi:hypothetical protein